MSTETDMAIQLFMQATILLSNYYGYPTIRYSEIQERSNRAGFNALPFMPPETVRATPELVSFFNSYENNPAQLDLLLSRYGGYKVLVKYYIRTGLRASQMICRNYLLNLEERNQYLEFLQKEIGVAATVSTGILALVNANATLSQAFLIGRTGVDGAIDAYQEFRFLNVDREAARALVETAQNKLAAHFLEQVDSASANSNLVTGGYTFSDALHAVSMIEYQCTRTGIRHLLNRSINNSPSNLVVDQLTGTLVFRSTKVDTIDGGVGERPIHPSLPRAAPPLPPAPALVPSRIIVAPAGDDVLVETPRRPRRQRESAVDPGPNRDPRPDGPPAVTVRLARDAASRELDAFVRPGGPGTTPNRERQAKLESLLKQIDPNAPSLLDVIRFEPHQALRDKLLAAHRASPVDGGEGGQAAGSQTVRLARDAAARELDAFVRPGGPGTPPNSERQAKLERLLRQINPNAPSLLDVIRFEPHQELRNKLLAALKANP